MITEEKIKKALAAGEKDPRKTKEAEHADLAVDSNLFRKMRMGVDEWHPIDIVGNDDPSDIIYMRILSIVETMDVEREALEWFGKLLPIQQTIPLLEKKKAILTIKKALSSSRSSPDDYKYVANDETIEHMSFAGIQLILRKYDEICSKYNPELDSLTDDEYNEYVKALCDESIDQKKRLLLVKSISRVRLEMILLRLLEDSTSLVDSLHTALLPKDI